jgi:hypothetical protein
MMLDAMAGENADAAIIHVNGQGDGHGAFGKLQAAAFIVWHLQPIGDQIELPARHAKRRVIVNFHAASLARRGDLAMQIR